MHFSRDLLLTLDAVATGGSFEAAAHSLRVTPSAISQRVRAFEQQLGRVLVVRSRPVTLTDDAAALLRLARQITVLEQDAAATLGMLDEHAASSIPIAVNADSMATWILPPLARIAAGHDIVVDLHRDDQDHTTALLAAGTVMAAVTSESRAVPGCTVTALGRMTYRPLCTPAFAARWFAGGVDAAALAVAPLVDFDRKDELQSRYLRSVSRRRLDPPRNFVPASADFMIAVELGLGWAMVPDVQSAAARAEGRLVDLDAGGAIHVPLYWQQWDLRSHLLDAVAAEILAEARTALA